jgi:hypothetical protein
VADPGKEVEARIAAEREAERARRLVALERELSAQREDEERALMEKRGRREAAALADRLALERRILEERIEEDALALNRDLTELEALHRRQSDALRRAGLPLPADYSLREVVTVRWRQWFGGQGNLTGTPAAHWSSEDVPLHERDPLAQVRREGQHGSEEFYGSP